MYNLLLQVSTHALRSAFENEHSAYVQQLPKSFFSNFEQMTQVQETKAAKSVIMVSACDDFLPCLNSCTSEIKLGN